MAYLSLIASGLSLIPSVFGDDHGVAFQYPPANLKLNYKDTINVSYTSPFANPILYAFCTKPGSETILTELVRNITEVKTNDANLVNLDWPGVSNCWINIRPNHTARNGANSPKFSVLAEARATPITAGIEQSTSTTSSSSSSSASSTASPMSTPSSKSSSGTLSGGAKIGVGIGVALGLLLVGACLLVMFLRKRKQDRSGGANGQFLDNDGNAIRLDSSEGQHKAPLAPWQSVSAKGGARHEKSQPMPVEIEAGQGNVNSTHELAATSAPMVFELATGPEKRS